MGGEGVAPVDTPVDAKDNEAAPHNTPDGDEVYGVVVQDVRCPAVIRSYLEAARTMWQWSGQVLPTQYLHIWSEGAILIVMGVEDGSPVRAGAIMSSTNSHLNRWFTSVSSDGGVAHYTLFSVLTKNSTLCHRLENDSREWMVMDSSVSAGRFWYGAGAPRGHLRGARVASDPHKYVCDKHTGAFIKVLESNQTCSCGCMQVHNDGAEDPAGVIVGSIENPLLKMRACTREETYTSDPGVVSDDRDMSAVHFTFLMCDIPKCRWTRQNFSNIVSMYQLLADGDESDM